MCCPFRRYDLQSLQNRLESSSMAVASGMPGGMNSAVSNALATTVVYENFKHIAEQTRSHVATLKMESLSLKNLKAKFTGPLIPRAIQSDMLGLERKLTQDYGVLSNMIKQLNEVMTQFLSGPLVNNKVLLSMVEQQRHALYNELEQLRQLSSDTTTTQMTTSPLSYGSTSSAAPGTSAQMANQQRAAVYTASTIPNAQMRAVYNPPGTSAGRRAPLPPTSLAQMRAAHVPMATQRLPGPNHRHHQQPRPQSHPHPPSLQHHHNTLQQQRGVVNIAGSGQHRHRHQDEVSSTTGIQ